MKFHYLVGEAEKLLAPFFSPRITTAMFNSMLILGGLCLAFWPWEGLVTYMAQHRSPALFSAIAIAALIINSYLSLRCGRGELVKLDGGLRREAGRPYPLRGFLLYPFLLFAPVLPLFILATAVSGVSARACGKAWTIIFTAAVLCWLVGFLMDFGRGNIRLLGYLGARIFLLVFIFATFVTTPKISPLALLYELNRNPHNGGFALTDSDTLYMLTVFSAIALLVSVNWLMNRKNRRG